LLSTKSNYLNDIALYSAVMPRRDGTSGSICVDRVWKGLYVQATQKCYIWMRKGQK